MEMFPTGIYPEYTGNRRTVTPRVREAQLGDGYSQRVADGLNTLDEDNTWTFHLSDTDANTLEAFFVARAGWDAFSWQPPRYAASCNWICTSWSRTYEPGSYSTIVAQIKRVWDY
jgi:phage-related protein